MKAEEMINREDLRYEITQTKKLIEDIGEVTTYGVLVCKQGYEQSRDRTKCCRLNDISSKREIAQSFLLMLSENDVSPINVEECFEDFCSL